MQNLFYRLMSLLSRLLGSWVMRLGAWWVAGGFFFLFPRRRALSVAFYRALYPAAGPLSHLRCTWRQYQRFTTVFLERRHLHQPGRVLCTSTGWEHLDSVRAAGRGAVLLMSHLGNWEMAAHQMQARRPGLPLMLVMGRRAGEQIEALQKKTLSRSGIRVLAAGPEQDAALDVIEALAFLRGGGMVAMAGDRLWHPGQRAVAARFLGHRIALPELPHALAHMAGAPIMTCFAVRDDSGCHHFRFDPPDAPLHGERRAEFVRRSAQHYAEGLEGVLRAYPCEWFHFGPFLGEPLTAMEPPRADPQGGGGAAPQPGFSKKT